MNYPVIYDRLAELAFIKVFGQLSEEEEQELITIFEKQPNKKKLFDEMTDPANIVKDLMIMNELDVDASWEKYIQESSTSSKIVNPTKH